MRYLLTALFAVALSLGTGSAVPAEETVAIKFKAKVGDKATVVVRRQKSRPRLQKLGLELTAVITYDVEVTGKTADGYTFLWTPKDVKLEGVPDKMRAELKRLISASMVPIEFETDGAGVPTKIADREAALERALKFLSRSGKPNEKVVAQLRSMFTRMDDRTLALVFAKDASLLARWQQAELPVGSAVELEEARANPFGGGNLSSKVTVRTEPPKNGTANIAWTVDMDEKQMLTSMIANFKRMAKRLGRDPKEVDAQLGKAKIVFEESGKATINIADGWTRAVSFRRIVKLASPEKSRDQKEIVEITLKRAQ
ncbi:MAG: hypothetical protein MI824_24265 [Hyphomicrobiales bacterium]|nr:hypothetical protein [Hyphomicrobiales bacterium]